ncbi:MAG: TIGR04013 family B12-binding domain/radical SAM domain-containing protein [Thermosphaera sp.]
MINLMIQYDGRVKYSLNALIASVEKIGVAKVFLPTTFEQALEYATLARNSGEKCVYAVSLLTTMLVDDFYRVSLIETVRKMREAGCVTIAGGPHVSGDPIGTLYRIGVDFAFIGEAEKTLQDFLKALEDNDDVYAVKGIGYRTRDRLVFTGRESPINLDDYDPFPYWKGIVNPIEITRGCSYGCHYCQVSYVHGFRLRHRSLDRIIFYALESLKLGVRDLRFITPDSLSYGLSRTTDPVDSEKIISLLDELYKKVRDFGGRIFFGSFPSEIRPEHADHSLLKVMRRYVSNQELIIGGQSGSDRVLSMVKRGHGVEDVENAVDYALNAGFTPSVDFIIGFPGETREDMMMTLQFAEKLVLKGARIHLHYYIPLPGTPLGLRKPTPLPFEVRRAWSRLVGSGKAYGSWLNQEKISQGIINLIETGFINPRLKIHEV